MIALDEKIESLKDFNEAMLKAEIADYETLLNGGNRIIQPAIKGAKKHFNNIKTWGTYDLDHHNITTISIADMNSGYEYTQNIDYKLNDTWGMIEILSNGLIQDGINIIVTFSAEEYSYESMSEGMAFTINRDKSRDEIIELKKEAEAKLNDSYKLNPMGYPYFDDVCYLTEEQQSKYEEECELNGFDREEIFNTVNYLTYLYWFIRILKRSQKDVKRKRATAPPAKEIISILKHIEHEHEATAPLIRLLATFEGDHSNEIISHDNRIAYKVEKETAQATPPPALNIDKLSELKTEYKEKRNEVYTLMKQQNPRRYKEPSNELLKALNLPLKPSDI